MILSHLATVYISWAALAALWQVAGLVAGWCRVRGTLCQVPRVEEIGGQDVLLASQIYADTTLPQVKRNWFSLRDIAKRLGLCYFAFCYAAVSRPLSFLHYSYIYNGIFGGTLSAVLSTLFLPFWPLLVFLKALYNRNLNGVLPMLDVEDESLDSMRFFTNHLSPVSSFFYDLTQEFSNYMGNFYILGPCREAIQTMYWDTDKTTKVFWRAQLSGQGARIPKELGRWDGQQLALEAGALSYPSSLIKVTDSCMGVGDMFLEKDKDYSTWEELEGIFKTKYPAKHCILMEIVKPHPELGVHSLDILTARDPWGNVQLLDVVVWAGSPTQTSHCATNSYMLDPKTGRACSCGKWYNPNFVQTTKEGLGVVYPNVAQAVLTAIKTHKSLPYPWLTVVGWDCMVTEDSSIVFFEGNLAAWRCPRRLFLSWRSFIYFVRYLTVLDGPNREAGEGKSC